MQYLTKSMAAKPITRSCPPGELRARWPWYVRRPLGCVHIRHRHSPRTFSVRLWQCLCGKTCNRHIRNAALALPPDICIVLDITCHHLSSVLSLILPVICIVSDITCHHLSSVLFLILPVICIVPDITCHHLSSVLFLILPVTTCHLYCS